jgi:hypothetical protein
MFAARHFRTHQVAPWLLAVDDDAVHLGEDGEVAASANIVTGVPLQHNKQLRDRQGQSTYGSVLLFCMGSAWSYRCK